MSLHHLLIMFPMVQTNALKLIRLLLAMSAWPQREASFLKSAKTASYVKQLLPVSRNT